MSYVLEQINRETLDLSVKIFAFHKVLICRACGHRHKPGEFTHCFVINDLMYLLICNGCNDVDGGLSYLYEARM